MSTPSPHLYWLPRGAAEQLTREATARRCRPSTLAAALINGALSGGLVDAILDGDRPAKLAGGRPRDLVFGLTETERAACYVIGENAGPGGFCLLGLAQIARIVGLSRIPTASAIVGRLEQRGFVIGAPSARGQLRPLKLTCEGEAVWRDVGGEGGA